MSITFSALQELFKQEGLHFFVRPDAPQLIFGITGLFGRYQLLVSLLDDGTFLQIRSIDNPSCPSDHPHVAQVQALLGGLNTQYRLVKFAWDPSDGEIAAFADHWIMDNTLTLQQLHRILGNFLPALDIGHHRARGVIESGQDPGELGPDSPLGSHPGIPAPLRELLEKLAGEMGGSKSEDIDEL